MLSTKAPSAWTVVERNIGMACHDLTGRSVPRCMQWCWAPIVPSQAVFSNAGSTQMSENCYLAVQSLVSCNMRLFTNILTLHSKAASAATRS